MEYNYLCILNNKEIDFIKKNHHTLQFFCEIDNIINCDKINCKTKKGYKYERSFNEQELKESNIIKNKILQLYKQVKPEKTLKDDTLYLSYLSRNQRPSTTLHFGQLKLLLSEMQFLCYYAPKDIDVHIVYMGAAPGTSINILTKLFPQCYWYLIDPRKMDKRLRNNDKIKEIDCSYFTNCSADCYKKKLKGKYTLFISDIRSSSPDEHDIQKDNELQMNCVKIMNPDYALLKFRIPRINENYEYLYGKIYFQMYPSYATTETRLLVKKNAKMTTYNLDKYEGQMYYHNRISRVCIYQHDINDIDGIDHCYDCTLFVNMLKKYIKEYDSKMSVKQLYNNILNELHHPNKLKYHRNQILSKLQL